jgi:hypothetical protein
MDTRNIVNKFERDLQVVRLEGDAVGPGETIRHAISLPFDFIAIKLVATCFRVGTPVEGFGLESVGDPPLLVKLNMAGTDVDREPAPMRALWGSAKFPTILPNPYPLRKGDLISVEIQSKQVAATGQMFPVFTLIGYRPTRTQLQKMRDAVNALYLRPYQTTVAKPSQGNGQVTTVTFPANTRGDLYVANLSFDFVISKFVGSVFEIDGVGTYPVAEQNPSVFNQLESKSQLIDTQDEPFRNMFGNGENPNIINPPMVMRSGDEIRVFAKQYTQIVPANVVPYYVFSGCVPVAAEMDRLEQMRGQMRGDLIVPDPITRMRGGNVVKR